jgi:hypothetical protein
MNAPVTQARYLALINNDQSDEVTYIKKGDCSDEYIVQWGEDQYVATAINEDAEGEEPYFQFRERDRV